MVDWKNSPRLPTTNSKENQYLPGFKSVIKIFLIHRQQLLVQQLRTCDTMIMKRNALRIKAEVKISQKKEARNSAYCIKGTGRTRAQISEPTPFM